jgi:arylsulfatase A-like enzyme
MKIFDNRVSAGIVWLLVTLLLGSVGGKLAIAAEEPLQRPNIVFVLTDDEDFKAHAYLPKVKALLADRGAVFDNYFVSYSFCCPSRTTAMRGQYPHNHRVVGNDIPSGGFPKFHEMGLENSTIATWLQAAGYHTALLGKFLNHYHPQTDAPVQGWDDWYVPGSNGHTYFDYWMNENGTPVHYGSRPEDYLTDVMTRRTTAIIREQAAAGTPFFIYVAPYAPHSPATPAPRHAGMFLDVTYPRTPAFDEPDVADKPSLVRELPPLAEWELAAIDRHHCERIQSMQAVDDMVESIVATLEETGQLDNTYILYASDNGFHQGEHRMFFGKTTAYEEDIHVPMILRGPGVPEGVKVKPFVLNNDLAPTFAAMAGVTPPDFVDGRNFLPLLTDAEQPWRQSFKIERRQRETHELTGTARFDAIRTSEWTYVEYGNGQRELYDLLRDPFQVQNHIAKADPELVNALSQRLAELATCAGSACRTFEDMPLVLPETVPVADATPLAPLVKPVAAKPTVGLPRVDVGKAGMPQPAVTPVTASP